MPVFGSRGPKKFEEALSRAEERLRAYGRRPDPASSDAALDAYLVAADAWPAGGPGLDDRFVILTVNLAATLTDLGRAERESLAAAVSIGRGAGHFLPPGHYARAKLLTNLGTALECLYLLDGEAATLAEAVEAAREAAAEAPEGHPDRAICQANLSLRLQAWGGLRGDRDTLAEAVGAAQQAVAAADPGATAPASYVNGLNQARFALFEWTQDTQLLIDVAEDGREVMAVTSVDDPQRLVCAIDRATALRARARRTGDRAALREAGAMLEEAVTAGQAALASAPPGHHMRVDILQRLASALNALADQVGDGSMRAEAVECYLEIGYSEQAAVPARITALRGAVVAMSRLAHPPVDVLAVAEDAVELMPKAGPRSLSSADWQYRLDQIGSLAELVAAAAAAADQPERAVELLERARGLLLGDTVNVPGATRTSGFAEIAAQAVDGPVVFVSASVLRCDALILTGGPAARIELVPLIRLTRADVVRQIDRLAFACRSEATDKAAQAVIGEVLEWLWETVAGPVLSALGYHGAPAPGQRWPRLWWCPVGLMAFLPLHAAGHHREAAVNATADPTAAGSPETVMDRVVSSYTATVRSLKYARDPGRPGAPDPWPLIIAVPDAPGTRLLAGVVTEAKAISTLLPRSTVLADLVRDAVLAALPKHQIAHFACHGVANTSDPSASRLLMRDYEARPLTVSDIGALSDVSGLAYLSACDTTVTRATLADEAIHITGAFHLAGYQHVIGTLWPVNDAVAGDLAVEFYRRLITGGDALPDLSRCAEALQHAIRGLRAHYPDHPSLWAAYTHTGC